MVKVRMNGVETIRPINRLLPLEVHMVRLGHEKLGQRLTELSGRTTHRMALKERRQFSHSVNNFSLQKAVQFVPRFNEAEPEQFFESFENQARALRWPEQHWASLVHTALSGKAQEFTSVLNDAEFSDYQVVKTTVLGAYTCIPAKYRKTFKLNRRQLGQSLVDFVRQQTKAFTSWYKASGVSTFEDLVQLILIDNLLESVGPEVRVFLQDRDLTTALEAARLADTFETNRSLSERSRLSFQQSGVSRDRQHWRMKCQPEGERLRHPTKSPGEPRFSTYGPPAERQTTYGASRQQYPERYQPERHHLQRHQGVKGKPVVCFRCNKIGMNLYRCCCSQYERRCKSLQGIVRLS
ncbi:uncharacterized protein [Cherax quadricarinatus]|uniref:uncharacterized protein n=1 Tax=Cherax quadricarinatus TaxID=27406 RepID=UPI00387EB2FB